MTNSSSISLHTTDSDAVTQDIRDTYRDDVRSKALITQSTRAARRSRKGFAVKAGATSGGVLLHVDI